LLDSGKPKTEIPVYGSETGTQLKKFQKDQGLAVDGVAGKLTLTRVDDLLMSQQQSSCNAAAENAALAAQMAGPKGNRPFAATTARRGA